MPEIHRKPEISDTEKLGWPNLAACSVRYGNSIEQRALDKASVIIPVSYTHLRL